MDISQIATILLSGVVAAIGSMVVNYFTVLRQIKITAKNKTLLILSYLSNEFKLSISFSRLKNLGDQMSGDISPLGEKFLKEEMNIIDNLSLICNDGQIKEIQDLLARYDYIAVREKVLKIKI